MLRHLILLCASALTLALVAPLSAQGTVDGRITTPDRVTPVAGAIVHVVGTTLGARTDSLGRFRILSVPAGRYGLEARAQGHTLEEVTVVVRDDTTVTAAIILAPAPRDLAGITVIGATSDALERIPGAATAIGTRQLRAQAPLSANEVLRTVPGVHILEEEGAGLRANVGIRGLDPDRSRSVLVLEDGVPVALAPYGEPEMYYSPPIDRMSRVEVIKGSGSILFGPQTIGGVVNYVTSEPPAGLGGRVDLRGGGGGQGFGKVELGGTRGGARGLVSAFERRADNFNGLDYRLRDLSVKGGVRTAIGDLSAKVGLYDEHSNATYLGLTDSLYRVSPAMHPAPDDRLEVRRQAVTGTHELAIGSATTLRTTAYAYRTTRDWLRRDYTYGPTGGTIVYGSGTGSRDRSFDVGGIEPRLRTLWNLGSLTSDLDVGARFHLERARDRFVLGTADGTPTAVRDDEVRNGRAWSAWLQNRLALHPALHLTPGVRIEHFQFDRHITRARVRRTDGTTTTQTIEDVDIRSGGAVTEVIPGLAATWRPRPLVTLLAGAHRGFAPPRTKDALLYSDPTLAPNEQVPDPVSLNLDAERSWNYELGARLAPKPFLSFEATAFLLDFTNQIIEPSLSAGSTTAAALANQGATRHHGVEVGGAFDIGKALGRAFTLTLEGNVTLVNATFSRDRFMRLGGDTVNVRGNRLPYAPHDRAHVALSLDTPGGLRARVDGIHVGAQYSDNFETVAASANGRTGRIPAYHILDATVQHDVPMLPGVRIVGSVKNLTDRTFIASRRPEGIKVGLPRTLSVGLSWDF